MPKIETLALALVENSITNNPLRIQQAIKGLKNCTELNNLTLILGDNNADSYLDLL